MEQKRRQSDPAHKEGNGGEEGPVKILNTDVFNQSLTTSCHFLDYSKTSHCLKGPEHK